MNRRGITWVLGDRPGPARPDVGCRCPTSAGECAMVLPCRPGECLGAGPRKDAPPPWPPARPQFPFEDER